MKRIAAGITILMAVASIWLLFGCAPRHFSGGGLLAPHENKDPSNARAFERIGTTMAVAHVFLQNLQMAVYKNKCLGFLVWRIILFG